MRGFIFVTNPEGKKSAVNIDNIVWVIDNFIYFGGLAHIPCQETFEEIMEKIEEAIENAERKDDP